VDYTDETDMPKAGSREWMKAKGELRNADCERRGYEAVEKSTGNSKTEPNKTKRRQQNQKFGCRLRLFLFTGFVTESGSQPRAGCVSLSANRNGAPVESASV
jgi:hypothetical protein